MYLADFSQTWRLPASTRQVRGSSLHSCSSLVTPCPGRATPHTIDCQVLINHFVGYVPVNNAVNGSVMIGGGAAAARPDQAGTVQDVE